MPTLTPQTVLSRVPKSLSAEGASVSWRWWRWLVDISEEHLAFVAEDETAWERLCREEALLAQIAPRMSVQIPSVVLRDEALKVQVRKKVFGLCLDVTAAEKIVFGREGLSSRERYLPSCPLTREGARLAVTLGRATAALHQAITVEEATALGFGIHSPVQMLEEVEAQIAPSPELSDIGATLFGVKRWFGGLERLPALCHRDIQSYNFVVAEDGALLGLFDFEDAAVAHRAEDLKYFISYGIPFTEVALEAYSAAGGAPLSLETIGYFHALSALEHFLFIPKEHPRWPHIVRWTRDALEHFVTR